jgi:hypothetical protein
MGRGSSTAFSLEELKRLDAGYAWTKDAGQSYPFRGQGITIPTLEEVLDAFPGMFVNIDIKQAEPSIVEPFCDLLRRLMPWSACGWARSMIRSWLNSAAPCPQVPTAAGVSEVRLFYAFNRARLSWLYRPARPIIPDPRDGRRAAPGDAAVHPRRARPGPGDPYLDGEPGDGYGAADRVGRRRADYRLPRPAAGPVGPLTSQPVILQHPTCAGRARSWRSSPAWVPRSTTRPRSSTRISSMLSIPTRRCVISRVDRPVHQRAQRPQHLALGERVQVGRRLVQDEQGRVFQQRRAIARRWRSPPLRLSPRSPISVSSPCGRRPPARSS